MGVVFIVLIALMLASSAMSWFDASETVRRVALRLSRSGGPLSLPRGQERSVDATPGAITASGPTGEEVAAIAVAIALGRARGARGREPTLAPREPAAAAGPSGWAAAGRRRAMERAARFSR